MVVVALPVDSRLIIHWREKLQKSRNDLAGALGVSLAAISQWETGVTGRIDVGAICKVFGITLATFYSEEPNLDRPRPARDTKRAKRRRSRMARNSRAAATR